MRTFGLLLQQSAQQQLRGRRRRLHHTPPELSVLLFSGPFDLSSSSRSPPPPPRSSGVTHLLGQAVNPHPFSAQRHTTYATGFGGLGSAAAASGGSAAIRRDGTKEWITYDLPAFAQYYRTRPFKVAARAAILISEVLLLSIGHVVVKDRQKRAERLKRTLIRLGAFYVKLGQALSTRPDILPNEYCLELAKLQDHVPPVPTSVALEFLESELGLPASELYEYITPEPVAAASLGQVYKARLHSGEMVAVKVQRPGVTGRLALDSYLLSVLGGPLQKFAGARSDVIAMLNEIVERMFEEVDYIQEGRYAERFNKLYGTIEDDDSEPEALRGVKRVKVQRKLSEEGSLEGMMVKVPKVYWDLTSRGVLTMEWVDGLKLTDKEALRSASLDTQSLVEQGVFCSLRQLLEEGFFHADPHPGNLVVTKGGVLAYFDFGMMSEISKAHRIGLIRTIVHFVNRDSLGLAEDFKVLGFISSDADTKPIADALRRTFEVEGTKNRLDFQGIMAQLSEVMYRFQFRLPPEYAMVIRALGSLEGTATTLDPGFRVVASAYPFIIGRLLADPDPAMRGILQELLIRGNGSIRWHRLERLVFAIAEQSSVASTRDEGARASWRGRDGLGQRAASGIRGKFNTRAVASATMDVFHHILSDNGVRIRTLLVQDITQAFDHFLHQSVAELLVLNHDLSNTVGAGLGSQQPHQPHQRQQPHEHQKPQKPQEIQEPQELQEPQEPIGWSHYASASYWGRIAASKVIGKGFGGVDDERGTDAGAQGGEDVNSAADDPGVDDYTSRLKVGLHAFANAVNSSPEIWIPLLARLTSNPEARSLAAAVTSSLYNVHRSRTSEASFLLMSRALHKCDDPGDSQSPHIDQDFVENKVSD